LSIMKILVVDDSEAFRMVLAELLVRSGFHDVLEASDFEEAVSIFETSRPKFTFVDMILPGRSGVELTKELLSLDGNTIVIAMSSIINKKMIQQSLEAGAKDFLLKPTNEIALNSVLTMWSD
jgi:two-component system chemotaxis response regulator CheY